MSMLPDLAGADDLRRRVEDALEEGVRPDLRAEGGDVELAGLEPGGVVQVRLLGSCQGCDGGAIHARVMAIEAELKGRVPDVRYVEAVL
jgi:Fe-S cluster biogenesis protein NfuA